MDKIQNSFRTRSEPNGWFRFGKDASALYANPDKKADHAGERIALPQGAQTNLAIGITIHRPDLDLLRQLLSTTRGMGAVVLLHIDGPVGSAIDEEALEVLRAQASESGAAITQSSLNEGIAGALNRLAFEAAKRGCRSILYFDQDSDPAPDLADRLRSAMVRLKAGGQRPAVLGPRPVTAEAASKAPHYHVRGPADIETGCQPVDYVITSGSLIDLEAFEALGLFREEYRIDAVDTEWCFRAWSREQSVWMLPTALMAHRIGHGLVRFGPLAFPRQSEARMETYISNQARMLRLGYVPLRWKLRSLLYVPLQGAIYAALVSKTPLATVRRFLAAAGSGWLAKPPAQKTVPKTWMP